MGWYGLVEEGNPNRAGFGVAKYDGWPMVNIIREYAEKDWTNLFVRLEFRRALLMSHECTQMSKRARFAL
jgi:hypothetical protein